MRKQMKTMEEKNASYMQQTIDLQEVHCFMIKPPPIAKKICIHR